MSMINMLMISMLMINMKNMDIQDMNMSIINMILEDVLTALYQPFWFSVLAAVLFMFLWLYAGEHGWKEAARHWWSAFRSSAQFRRVLLLAFFTMMILMKTLLNRDMWLNPLCNVMGGWTLYDMEGNLTAEAIENVMLLIPFTTLLLWSFPKELRLKNENGNEKEKDQAVTSRLRLRSVLWKAIKYAFLFSLTIELLQLFLRLGTFQVADLVYNTLGGMLGGLLYYIACAWKNRKNRRSS